MQPAVIYSRVSTNKQDADNQIQVLESWAKERGLEVIGVYTETETAWRDGHQQELARLVRDARKGRFSFVLVWALDTLSRLGSLSILSLIHKLASYGVKGQEAPQKTIAEIALVFEHGTWLKFQRPKWDVCCRR